MSLRFIYREGVYKKCELFQPMLYEYNLGSYCIHSLKFNFLLLRVVIKMHLRLKLPQNVQKFVVRIDTFLTSTLL